MNYVDCLLRKLLEGIVHLLIISSALNNGTITMPKAIPDQKLSPQQLPTNRFDLDKPRFMGFVPSIRDKQITRLGMVYDYDVVFIYGSSADLLCTERIRDNRRVQIVYGVLHTSYKAVVF